MNANEIMAEFRAKIGTVYEVGPGKKYENVNDVPWESLQPGDTVNIYWREAPYKEKFLIAAQGNKELPIIIHGVLGPKGQLPLIDGKDATTRTAVPTDNTNIDRWVVKIGGPGTDLKHTYISRYITIENLEIVGARPENQYTEWDGTVRNYHTFCAGMWLDRGEHIVIRNCTIHDNSNGLFINSRDIPEEGFFVSRDILIDSNYFYDNGVPGSMLEHNSYCAAIGTVYQNNHYGPLRAGGYGYGLKDRGSGTIIRYNWIEGGRRQISLDDGEDNPLIPLAPDYNDSYVYGNVLVENDDGPIRLWGDDEIIHFGGDNAKIPNRNGTLYFYNNTVITYRNKKEYKENSLDMVNAYPYDFAKSWTTKGRVERTSLFLMPSGQHVEAVNNIFFAAGSDPAPLSVISTTGTVHLSHNWLSRGWVPTMDSGWDDPNTDKRFKGELNDDGTNITGDNPGFVDAAAQDFRLAAGSPCINAGTDVNTEEALASYKLVREYVKHKTSEERKDPVVRNMGALKVVD